MTKTLANNNKTWTESRVYHATCRLAPTQKILRQVVFAQKEGERPIWQTELGNKRMSNGQKTAAVIDDEPRIRTAMATLLSSFEYCVETYDSAETFLKRATTSKAQLLLVDVQLGGISGTQLAHQLAVQKFKLPIIFMTGCDDEGLACQTAKAGGIALLHKPFPAKMLIDAIKKAIG
jgi:CheY-like chemotaxis protein